MDTADLTEDSGYFSSGGINDYSVGKGHTSFQSIFTNREARATLPQVPFVLDDEVDFNLYLDMPEANVDNGDFLEGPRGEENSALSKSYEEASNLDDGAVIMSYPLDTMSHSLTDRSSQISASRPSINETSLDTTKFKLCCPACGKASARRSDLERHIIDFHGQFSLEVELPNREKTERIEIDKDHLSCGYCCQTFPEAKKWAKHVTMANCGPSNRSWSVLNQILGILRLATPSCRWHEHRSPADTFLDPSTRTTKTPYKLLEELETSPNVTDEQLRQSVRLLSLSGISSVQMFDAAFVVTTRFTNGSHGETDAQAHHPRERDISIQHTEALGQKQLLPRSGLGPQDSNQPTYHSIPSLPISERVSSSPPQIIPRHSSHSSFLDHSAIIAGLDPMQHSGQQELRGDIISVEPTTAGTFGQEITEVYAPPAVKQVKKRIRGTGMFYHANENGFIKQTGEFFKKFRVFAMLWSPSTEAAKGSDVTTQVESLTESLKERLSMGGEEHKSSDQSIVYKMRWFVVIKEGRKECYCLSIVTNRGRGAARVGATKADYAPVYTNESSLSLLKDEQARQGEKPMRTPIRIDTKDRGDKLDKMARIDYGKLYTIKKDSAEVRPFGWVNQASKKDVEYDTRNVYYPKPRSYGSWIAITHHQTASGEDVSTTGAAKRPVQAVDIGDNNATTHRDSSYDAGKRRKFGSGASVE